MYFCIFTTRCSELYFLKMIVLKRFNMFYPILAYEMTLVISVYLDFPCLPLYLCLLCSYSKEPPFFISQVSLAPEIFSWCQHQKK